MIPIITRLKTELVELLVIDAANDTDKLSDLGADSLDLVDISCLIEDEFGVKISETEISIETTVAELAALIENRK